jgi:hypothetical protein
MNTAPRSVAAMDGPRRRSPVSRAWNHFSLDARVPQKALHPGLYAAARIRGLKRVAAPLRGAELSFPVPTFASADARVLAALTAVIDFNEGNHSLLYNSRG